MNSYTNTQSGFTILEIIVAVAIIAILLSTVISGFTPAREQARDAQRQTDMRTVEAALALYKNKYGQYPAACNGATTGTSPNWSGQEGSGHECSPGEQYMVGIAPEFLPELPTDPRLNPDETFSGYVYAVNEDRSVYKFMALNTVETMLVEEGDMFFRCGSDFNSAVTSGVDNSNFASYGDGDISPSHLDGEICERVPPSPGGGFNAGNMNPPTACTSPGEYQATFAISGGFSSDSRSATRPERGEEYDTEVVRCG